MINKKVLITGASKGIGYATANLLAREGYVVYANYFKTSHTLTPLSHQLKSLGHTLIPVYGDVSNPIDVANIVKQTGSIDILINNAGISQFKTFTDISLDDWNNMLSVNLTSSFLCTQGVVSHMINNKWGKIINISSIWGVTGGSCEVHYSAAKAGMIGFTKALAKELGPSGIQVNCIAPGVIETDMNNDLSDADKAYLIQQTSLEKIGLPEDIAKTILFLIQDKFITGSVIQVNGGFSG